MAEAITDVVIPGVYIAVKAEGLIRAGAVSINNIGMVGTAKGKDDKDGFFKPKILSSFADAKTEFGEVDSTSLVRGLKLAFDNGARTIYAVKIPAKGGIQDYEKGLESLLNKDVHIIVTPGMNAPDITSPLLAHNENAENSHHERIAIAGWDTNKTNPEDLKGDVVDDDRILLVTPGVAMPDDNGKPVAYSGSYTACALAGLLSTLPPQSSPTNKMLSIASINEEYNYGELKNLVSSRVLAIQKKSGYRIVRGITTESGAWQQVTTRRIVDYAKYGIRSGSLSYIGKLNNERVRKSLAATLNGFLAGMKQEEMLTDYMLEVTATRDDEIQGQCLVTVTLKPTFSIDYIKVTIYLE